MTRRICQQVAFALLLVQIVGCSQDELNGVAVNGRVSYQGQPIESGEIIFRSTSGNLDVYAKIEAGRFEILNDKGLMPGAYRVEVYSPQKTGKMIPDPDEPALTTAEIYELLPAKYNEMTELTRQIEATTNELLFELE
ncbi:MAG: hypothetical protein MI725_18235 [Pirellulales bacterium]|nr:hypothetical protein [Pirellulales bacterium]